MAVRRTAVAAFLLWGFLQGAPAVGADDAHRIDWSAARPVTVRLVDDRFVPDTLVFEHGVPYRLHLENTGQHMHEFTAPEFLGAVVIRDPEALESSKSELVLQPGTRKDLYFVAPSPGQYELKCADHDWDGMTGKIRVE